MALSMKRRAGDWVRQNIAVPVIYALLRLIGFTLRHGREGYGEECQAQIKAGHPAVFAFWHGDCLAMTLEMRRALPFGDVYIMASHSRDGALMARFLTLAGARIVRGSSSRGGARALLTLVRQMTPRDSAALAIDGPRGPRHVVKEGVLLLARRTGLPVVPVVAHIARKWMVRSWDRTEIPQPFTRLVMAYGDPLYVPRDADVEAIARLRLELTARMYALKGEDPDPPDNAEAG